MNEINDFGNSYFALIKPYQTDKKNPPTMYWRYQSGNGAVLVERITIEDGISTHEKALGAWADRATLTYVPINDPLPSA